MGACFGNGKLVPKETKAPAAFSDSDDSDEHPLVRLKRLIKVVDID